MKYNERFVTFVVGMHRAGTSAVAGALSECGFDFGKDLIPNATENARGFYEHRIICSLHDELLYNLNSSWFGVSRLPNNWVSSDAAKKIKKRLKLELKKMLTRSDRPALKDPRLCRLFPIWVEICDLLGVEFRVVKVWRHPLEIAASLQKRNAFLPVASFRLYVIYEMEAEAYLKGHKVCNISYEDLIRKPKNTISSLYRDVTGAALDQGILGECGIDFELYRNKSWEVEFRSEVMGHYDHAIGIYQSYKNGESLPLAAAPYIGSVESISTSVSQLPYLVLYLSPSNPLVSLNHFVGQLPHSSVNFSILILDGALAHYIEKEQVDTYISKFSLVLGQLDQPDILLSFIQHTTFRDICVFSGPHVVKRSDLIEMIEKARMEPTHSKAWVYHQDDYALSGAVAHALKNSTIDNVRSPQRVRLTLDSGPCSIVQYLGRTVRGVGAYPESGLHPGCGSSEFSNDYPINRVSGYIRELIEPGKPGIKECTILIPIHNAYHQTRRCIESVLNSTDSRYSVVLLDDATNDIRLLEYISSVTANFPHVKIHSSVENLGFVETVNQGLNKLQGDVVLLNSDTEVFPGWLENLLECLYSNEKIGIVCPLSNNATLLTVPDINVANRPDYFSAQLIAKLIGLSSQKQYPAIPTAVGFCMLIRRDLINEIGLFDRAYGKGYSEECDYSMRAWRAGYEVVCADDTYVYHEGGASFSGSPLQDTYKHENEKILYRRFPDYPEVVKSYCITNPLRDLGERVHSLLSYAYGDLRPRLLIVSHRYDSTGGVELHLRGLVSVLSKYYRITVIHPAHALSSWTDVKREKFERGIEIVAYNRENIREDQHIIGVPAGVDDQVVGSWFRRFMSHGYWDLVHFHHLAGWNNLQLPQIAKSSGARVVLSLHDMYLLCPDYNMRGLDGGSCDRRIADGNDPGCGICIQEKHSRNNISRESIGIYLLRREKLSRNLFNWCDSIIFPSMYFYRRFVSVYGDEKMSRGLVIPHGISVQGIHQPNYDRERLSVGFVGRFCYTKGAEVFLRSVDMLNGNRFSFHVIGEADARYRKDIARLNIKYHGPYDHHQLVDLAKDIDIAVIPSLFTESYCITVSECQALGVPVIASRIGAIPERIMHNSTGFLFAAGNVYELVTILNQLYDEKARLHFVRDRLKSLKFPTIEENGEEYHRVYLRLTYGDQSRERNLLREDRSGINRPWLGGYQNTSPKYLLGTQAYRDYLESEDSRGSEHSKLIDSLFVVLLCKNYTKEEVEGSLASLVCCQGDQFSILLVLYGASSGGSIGEREGVEIIEASTIASANWIISGREEKWLLVFEAGDLLNPNEWPSCATSLRECQTECCWYGDVDRITSKGERYAPRFFGEFDVELMRSTLFLNSHLFIKKSVWYDQGGFLSVEGAIADLALKIYEEGGERAFGHLAGVLLHRLDTSEEQISEGARIQLVERHLSRCRIPADVRLGSDGQTLDVRYHRIRYLSVTVVLSVWSGYTDFPRCIMELAGIGNGVFVNIVVVLFGNDNFRHTCSIGRLNKEAVNVVWITGDAGQPFLALMKAAANSSSEFLLFFDIGLDAVSPNWFEKLLATMSQTDVAAVGGSTLSTSGETVGGGVVLGGGSEGIGLVAPFLTRPEWLAATPVGSGKRTVSCVTNECLLVRVEHFNECNGFDVDSFPADLAMVDLSIRWRKAGKRLVVDPSVMMRSKARYPGLSKIFFREGVCKEEEIAELFSRWLPELKSDPTHNERLSFVRFGEPQLRFSGVRDNPSIFSRRIAAYPFDEWGIGEYRVKAPMRALEASGRHEVSLLGEGATPLPTPVEMERGNFDVVYLHNALHDQHLRRIAQYRFLNELPVVFGQDDLLTHLPEYNPFSKTNYENIAKRIRGVLGLCSRLIVTTEPLAEIYSATGIETIVIPNYLERERWAPHVSLVEQREFTQTPKPRVGWAGASQHAGDLELLIPVVEYYSSSIDWVFFGECPAELRRYAKEVHAAVPFARYPEKLASLCLDLALAPLVSNEFNEAKSNLKILEYGVLGFPVLCSDLRPYQGAPVALTQNSPRAWIDAIAEQLEDRQTLSSRAEMLQKWVLEGWMLDQHIDKWSKAFEI